MGITRFKTGDTRPFKGKVVADGRAVNLTGATVAFHMLQVVPGALPLIGAATILDAAKGLVSYAWQTGDLDVPGLYKAEFMVTFGDGTIERFPGSEDEFIEVKQSVA